MKNPQTILITGASSGIGEALAETYATPGRILTLTGRNSERLHRVAEKCRQRGAETHAEILDAQNAEAMAHRLLTIDSKNPIDLAIANAGISSGTGNGGESVEQVRELFKTNVDGVINTIYPLLPKMRQRRRGQIAIVSSLAGFRGFAGAPAYCAGKAAVRVLGEALRAELASEGVEVTVICPGFVRSRITDANTFPMPFFMEALPAARIIQRRLERNPSRIAFPWPMAFGVWLLAALPASVADIIASRAPRKHAQ
ncbi:Short-subunit dehydrogenase [Azospirillaceae bacterium]